MTAKMRWWLLITGFLIAIRAFSFTSPRGTIPTTKVTANEHQLTPVSAAERIAKATTISELLGAEQYLIHPGEETMHYHEQLVHQRKRQRAATNALMRLIKFVIGVAAANEKENALRSTAFHRLVVSATSSVAGKPLPWADVTDIHSYIDALRALGALAPLPSHTMEHVSNLLSSFDDSFNSHSAEFSLLSPARISAIEWASRRLQYNPSTTSSAGTGIVSAQSALKLPFRVLHGLATNVTHLEQIRKEVSFKSEILTTRDGRVVNERRETCWMADEGIGGLAYSGKIMSPVPFADCVARVRDAVEVATGVYYDCCLINWYQDGECACKFHSDPDHGKLWAYDTVVVSIGETRRFNLRAIPDGAASSTLALDKEQEQEHHSFHLYDGDVFYMFGDCQGSFQHAVLKSEGPTNNSPRSSIVFKKSLPGPGGRRGHGLTKSPPLTKNSGTRSPTAGGQPSNRPKPTGTDSKGPSPSARDINTSADRGARASGFKPSQRGKKNSTPVTK